MSKLKLSPPWDIFISEVEALFVYDDEVHVVAEAVEHPESDTKLYADDLEVATALVGDGCTYIIKLYVDNAEKAEALTEIMPAKKEFGNVSVGIEVIPSNKQMKHKVYADESVFERAFQSNPIVSFVKTIDFFQSTLTYVVFEKIVAQFFTDDLLDLHGYRSMLYQDVAKDVFGNIPGVSFCTNVTRD